ncbi:hypothetical protein XELAEV_18015035mg [Xenopus laevis]|uniref:Uncharacterized protein n=1 Tax=Xenopus laevis TaxID=8355 RepID=A0A974DHM6_XENLA|nr:hypothetical protein XELAEV_18015035mg [Xenopus laevis]
MFDENMSAFQTSQSVCQWCTALGLNPRKVAAVGPMVPRVQALTTQYAVKTPESVPLNKTLFDSPAEKSQEKRCPPCESVHSSGGRMDTPEIVSALRQLTDQLTLLAWNGNFKSVFRLDWPETTMRRKILESLRSPAVDVVKSYMVGHPDATSGDLIEVSGDREGRFVCLSCVARTSLRVLVSRGVFTDDEMDSLRFRQLKRETLNSDPVAMTIIAHYQDKLPPGYVALMERVRREKGEAYVRVKQSSTSGHAEKSPAGAKLLKEASQSFGG